jgi:molybdate transport system substrate-binding protein
VQPKRRRLSRIDSIPLFLIGALLFVFLLPGPAPGGQTKSNHEILVSAASSLKDVLEAIAASFIKSNPGIKLDFNYGASGQLRIQIENGAPADVFISAAASDMDALAKKGLIAPNTRCQVTRNLLVLVCNRTLGPRLKKMEDLLGRATVRVAIGNPVTVPAGRYAKEVLESSGLYNRLKDKLVLGENVRQVLDYVARGEVDAGFVYKTDALGEPKAEIVETIRENRHTPIVYPAAVIAASGNAAGAAKFVQYLRSGEAQAIFRKFGFE